MKYKIVKVKIETPKGIKYLDYIDKKAYMTDKQLGDIRNVCTCETCPYGIELCRYLIDPRYPTIINRRFSDFCGTGNTELANFGDYVPVKGTLEDNLNDIEDFYKTLIRANPTVKLTDVIDKVCDGGCDMYKPDHSECTYSNNFCILRNLFKNNGRE